MFNKFELELEKKYRYKFKVIKKDGLIEIICDNKEFESDENKIDEILEIASKYLSEDDLWNIGIVYDYLDEIKNKCMQIDSFFESTRELKELQSYEIGKVKYSYNYTGKEKRLKNSRKILGGVKRFTSLIEKAIDLTISDNKETKYQLNFKQVF